MLPPIPNEKKSPSTVNLPDELEKKVNDFASQHNINKSAAIRYILSVFFNTIYPKWIENNQKSIVQAPQNGNEETEL